jgi:hypothetical protein
LRKATFNDLLPLWFITGNPVWPSNLLASADTITRSNFFFMMPASAPTVSNLLASADSGGKSNFYTDIWTNVPPYTNLPPYSNGVSSTVIASGNDQVLIYSALSNKLFSIMLSNVFKASFGFVSTNVTVRSNQSVVIPHGLPAQPQSVRWVYVCTNAAAGYQPGQEVDISAIFCKDIGFPMYSWGADATSVYISEFNTVYPAYVMSTNGVITALSTNDWRLKAYVRYFP